MSTTTDNDSHGTSAKSMTINGSASSASSLSHEVHDGKRKASDDNKDENGKLARSTGNVDVAAAKHNNDLKESKSKTDADDIKKENALETWSSIREKLAGRRLAVFLDCMLLVPPPMALNLPLLPRPSYILN
jgi:hypothetical protein